MAQAQQISQEAIAIARATGDKQILGYGLEYYAYATNYSGEFGGEAAAQEGLEIFSNEVNDNFGLSLAYMCMGINAARKGDVLEKQKYFGKLKETIGKEAGSFQAGFLLISIGMTESSEGNYQGANQIDKAALRASLSMQSNLVKSCRANWVTWPGTPAACLKPKRSTGKPSGTGRSRESRPIASIGIYWFSSADNEPQRAI